jgi:hypothetical protein
VPTSGLREESFRFLRGGGQPVPTLPVTIAFHADGSRHIVDGRHRILLAREAGKSHVDARLLGYGPRLGVVWRHRGRVPI